MSFGIIAEYNPFHNGHFYHIAKSKELTKSENCIIIMSGNFVQRGEPAIINKQIRTKAALINGASIVIELPVVFATGSADIFAFGAINILNSTNIIDSICFGSETKDIDLMTKISKILISEPPEFKEYLLNELSKGISYPSARHNALLYYINNNKMRPVDISFLKLPNSILALEYIKALNKSKSKIKPIAIERLGNSFHSKEIESKTASAEAIRKAIKELEKSNFKNNPLEQLIKNTLPQNTHKLFFREIINYPKAENYMPILDYILRTKTREELSEILDITEGLENRILKYQSEKSIENILSKIKTKRYTLTKLSRALLHIILDIKKSDAYSYIKTGLPYIRILGFRKDKESLLRELIKNASVPVITNLKKAEKELPESALTLLRKETYSSDIYYMQTTKELNTEYTKPIVIV